MKQIGELFGKPVFTGRDVQRTFKKEDYIYLPSDKIEDLKKEGILGNQNVDNYDPFNGYEYVDLELPSGTLWATSNVGANSPYEYGLYFQFGSTIGYNDAKHSNWYTYPFNDVTGMLNKNYFNENKEKYFINNILKLEYDAAHVNMGGNWKLPTKEDLIELLNNTKYTLENKYFKLISKINNKFIVFPRNGMAVEGYFQNTDSNGFIQTSEIRNDYIDTNWVLKLQAGYGFSASADCRYGSAVRGIIK